MKGGQQHLTLEGQLLAHGPTSLCISDQSQDNAKAGRREQAAILRVGNLPYLAQDV